MKLTAQQIEAAKKDDRIDGICHDGQGFCYAALSCAHLGRCQRHAREPSNVRYSAVAMGALRTEEQQALLLARAGHRVWTEWCRKAEEGATYDGVQGMDPILDRAVRRLFQQIVETDVYYSRKRGEDV